MIVAAKKIALAGNAFTSWQMDAAMRASHHFFQRFWRCVFRCVIFRFRGFGFFGCACFYDPINQNSNN